MFQGSNFRPTYFADISNKVDSNYYKEIYKGLSIDDEELEKRLKEASQKVDVLKFISEGYCYLVVRSSGIEPNLKINITVNAADKESAMAMETAISK